MQMSVLKTILCDLTGYSIKTVDVSQGDRRSRVVRCRLLENGKPWIIPEGARVLVSYQLPDGTPGSYDTMPDGSPAGQVEGHTVFTDLVFGDAFPGLTRFIERTLCDRLEEKRLHDLNMREDMFLF